jgi:hypothetical protein
MRLVTNIFFSVPEKLSNRLTFIFGVSINVHRQTSVVMQTYVVRASKNVRSRNMDLRETRNLLLWTVTQEHGGHL